MRTQQQLSLNNTTPFPTVSGRGQRIARAMLQQLLTHMQRGHIHVVLPDGTTLDGRGREPGANAILTLHHWRAMRRIALEGTIGFAESYMDGDWDTPNLAALLTLGAENEAGFAGPLRGRRLTRMIQRFGHHLNRNTRAGSRRNIRAHYDLGNDFYQAWLDSGMSYSSALFTHPGQTLEDAQTAKQDRAIALLNLAPGSHVLEIGCGWGGLAERMIAQGHRVTGLTLSREQLLYAQQRLGRPDYAPRADMRFQDYRDLTEQFDAIVSIEMFEAVGTQYWPTYFETLRRALRPGGTIVLQVITISAERYRTYQSSTDFIQRHIFPGGMLPSAEILQTQIRKAGLVLTHTENFAESYARTLSIWGERFAAAWTRIATGTEFSEIFRRKWAFYLAYCEAGFSTGALDVGLYRITAPEGPA